MPKEDLISNLSSRNMKKQYNYKTIKQ